MSEWRGTDHYGFATIDTDARSRVSLEADCLYTIQALQAAVRNKDWDAIKQRHDKAEDNLALATSAFATVEGSALDSYEYFMFRTRKHEIQITKAFWDYARLKQEIDQQSESAKKYGPGARLYPQLIAEEIFKFKRTEAFRKALKFAMAQEEYDKLEGNKTMLLNFNFEGTN